VTETENTIIHYQLRSCWFV